MINNKLKIKNVVFNEGKPKICIPIMSVNKSMLLEEIQELNQYPYDVIEWRIDCYDDVFSVEKVLDTLQAIYEEVGNKLLLVTYRTHKEGGSKEISTTQYVRLLSAIMQSKLVDLIDVESEFDEESVSQLVKIANENAIHTVFSHHSFTQTYSSDKIIDCLETMDQKGASILKIAMMPKSPQDVLTLLQATTSMQTKTNKPIITMSMGKLGLISRLSGEVFGSCMTFASAKQASAPGQIQANEVENILNILKQ